MKFFTKLKEIFKKVIQSNEFNNIHNRFRLHDEVDYFEAYLNFISNSIYYSRFEHHINGKTIKGKYLNEKVNKWCKAGIFQKIYDCVIDDYLTKCPYSKHYYIDGHIVTNKYGNENKGRCVYYKSKNAYNLQALTDDNGSPLGLSLNKGSAYEGKLLIELFKTSHIEDGHKYCNSKKYKQYFIADSGYDQNYNREFLREKGYTPLILHNKRNCKNTDTIKRRKLTKQQMQHYKKRSIIETLFSWLECKIPRLIKMFDKKMNNYLNQAYLASADIVFSKLLRSN